MRVHRFRGARHVGAGSGQMPISRTAGLVVHGAGGNGRPLVRQVLVGMLALGMVLAGGSTSHAAAGPSYGVTDLGTLGGGFSSPIDVNNRGQVAGVSVDSSETALLGFTWSRGSIAATPSLGGPQTAAAAVNDAGDVAGWSDLTTPAPASIFNQTSLFCNPPMVDGQQPVVCRATLWKHGVPKDLGTLGGVNSSAENKGINNRGQVVGVAETRQPDPTGLPGAPRFHAFVWTDGRMTDLGTLGSDPDSIAVGINNHDQVVGVSIPDGANFTGENGRAVVWDHGHIHALPGLGGTRSLATSIDNAGNIVGAAWLPGDTTAHAVLWKSHRVVDLGTLPGDVFSEAGDIVGPDQIVGLSCSRDGACRATLWRNGTPIDVNTLIPASAGWVLFDVSAVNQRGQLVGDGLHNGEPHGFILTPGRG